MWDGYSRCGSDIAFERHRVDGGCGVTVVDVAVQVGAHGELELARATERVAYTGTGAGDMWSE
jgi:hypothetical protein